jgi:sRNA-binding protein
MTSPFATGAKEARQQLVVLREKWPIAFPIKPHDIRPLAVGTPGEIAAAMAWSLSYARGVLLPWKMAPAYCRAVLSYDQRIALDGTPAEPVDAVAKELATKQLAKLEARHATKQAAAAAKAKAKPEPAAPVQAPTLRDQVRAGLLRRRA